MRLKYLTFAFRLIYTLHDPRNPKSKFIKNMFIWLDDDDDDDDTDIDGIGRGGGRSLALGWLADAVAASTDGCCMAASCWDGVGGCASGGGWHCWVAAVAALARRNDGSDGDPGGCRGVADVERACAKG